MKVKILETIFVLFCVVLFNCLQVKEHKDIIYKEIREKELKRFTDSLLSSKSLMFEIVEEIKSYCEKDIPEVRSEYNIINNLNESFKNNTYHIDSIIKTTEDPERIIDEINKFIFVTLEIKPTPERDNLVYIFPTNVYKERKGNCIGLSLLYLTIGEKVRLPIEAVIVPGHLFVRYNDGEKIINIETLKRGESKTDNWYREKYLKKGMERYFLRKIDNKELVGIIFYNIATILMLRKRYDVSLKYFKIADEYLPEYLEIKGNMALALDGAGKSDSALNVLIDLRERSPGFENLEKNIGALQLKCKRYNDAIETYNRLCEKEPAIPGNYYGLALSYYYTGNRDKALFFIEKALKLKPDYQEAAFFLKKIRK